MSTEFKVEKIRLISGSVAGLVIPISDSPSSTHPAGTLGVSSTGRIYKSAGAGSWSEVGDTATLSGTINARVVDLSGSVNGHFNQLSGTVNARFASNTVAPFSASLTGSARPASVNISTEGTTDWLFMTTAHPRTIAAGVATLHSSMKGGWLVQTFTWKPGTNGTATSDSGAATTITSTASESTANVALNATTEATYHNNAGTLIADHGWTFRYPTRVGGGQRRIRIYGKNRSCILTITIRSSDGTLTPVVLTNVENTGAVNSNRLYEIVFTGPPGGEIIVTAQTSNATQAFPAIGVTAITVADI